MADVKVIMLVVLRECLLERNIGTPPHHNLKCFLFMQRYLLVNQIECCKKLFLDTEYT